MEEGTGENWGLQNPTRDDFNYVDPEFEDYCEYFLPLENYLPSHIINPNEYCGCLEDGLMAINSGCNETLHEQGLETSLRRLNLSTPSHQSQFLGPPAFLENTWYGGGGTSMHGNSFHDSPVATDPVTNIQELLRLETMGMQEQRLRMLRIQSAVRGQENYCTRPQGAPLFTAPSSSSSSFANSPFSNFMLAGRSSGAATSQSGSSNFNSSNGFNSQRRRQSAEAMSYDYPARSSSRPNGILLDSDQQRHTLPSLEELLEVTKDYQLRSNSWHDLMVYPLGCHKVQKHFEESTEEQLSEILLALCNNEQDLTRTCNDNYGSRSMQKLLEHLKTPEQISLAIAALRKVTLALAQSQNGQFVIKKCLKLFSAKRNQEIINEIAEKCVDIATDRSGCCVMQDCVKITANGESGKRLVAEITKNVLLLSEHPYGNYVVQYMLEMRMPDVREDIIAQLQGSFVTLSMNKYGSHVVQKCLQQLGKERSTGIVEELISCPSQFLSLCRDQYGNFVVQTANDVSKGTTHETLVRLIKDHILFLENHPRGKCVLASIKRKKQRGQVCKLCHA